MQFPCIWRFGGHSPGLFSTRASPLRQFLIGYNQNQKPNRKWKQKLKRKSVSKKLRFVLVFLKQKLETGYSPNISTNPLQQWGFRQFLPSSWTALRGKHCWHRIVVMGVVDTFRHSIGAIFWASQAGNFITSLTVLPVHVETLFLHSKKLTWKIKEQYKIQCNLYKVLNKKNHFPF